MGEGSGKKVAGNCLNIRPVTIVSPWEPFGQPVNACYFFKKSSYVVRLFPTDYADEHRF